MTELIHVFGGRRFAAGWHFRRPLVDSDPRSFCAGAAFCAWRVVLRVWFALPGGPEWVPLPEG